MWLKTEKKKPGKFSVWFGIAKHQLSYKTSSEVHREFSIQVFIKHIKK